MNNSVDIARYESIKGQIIDEKDVGHRFVEIYKITCKTTNKSYIGQAVVHVLNHKRYRPFGTMRRFNAHISEAFSQKKCQCALLNADIKLYGAENFMVEMIMVCYDNDADHYERVKILEHNTLTPNGYNATLHSTNSKCVTDDAYAYIFATKYNNVKSLDKPDEHYISPRVRDNLQSGWRVSINGIQTEYSSSKMSNNDKKELALQFVKRLREYINAKHLDDRETP